MKKCASLPGSFDHLSEEERKVRYSIEFVIDTAAESNRSTTFKLTMKRLVILFLKYKAIVYSNLTSNAEMQYKSEVLFSLEQEMLMLINEVKKDKEYLKSIIELYRQSKEQDFIALAELEAILEIFIDKENHLYDRETCILRSADCNIKGINCSFPDYGVDDSEAYNKALDEMILTLKEDNSLTY